MKQEPAQPLMPHIGIMGLVPDVWGDAWMPRHRLMTALGRYFNVVWMDPPKGWREWWIPSAAPPLVGLNSSVPDIPGFRLYRPSRWLPLLYRPRALAELTQRLRLRQARRMLENAAVRRLLLYIWRPDFADTVELMPETPVCYHVDDEYTFSDHDLPIPSQEERLLRRADLVIIHSPGLLDKKGHLNPRTRFVPNGVDFDSYATPAPEPQDLRRVPHPRAGYVGVIKHMLDFELLTTLAGRHPDWSFVFVGPRRPLGSKEGAMDVLTRLPNVFFLGGKPIAALPAYVQHLDVAMMCYERTDYTNYIYPLKLHEYLASGRPVIGTPIRTLADFGHVVTLATTEAEWSAALKASLEPAPNSAESTERRRAVARQHDWERLAAVVAQALCEMLGPTEVERFHDLTQGHGAG